MDKASEPMLSLSIRLKRMNIYRCSDEYFFARKYTADHLYTR